MPVCVDIRGAGRCSCRPACRWSTLVLLHRRILNGISQATREKLRLFDPSTLLRCLLLLSLLPLLDAAHHTRVCSSTRGLTCGVTWTKCRWGWLHRTSSVVPTPQPVHLQGRRHPRLQEHSLVLRPSRLHLELMPKHAQAGMVVPKGRVVTGGVRGLNARGGKGNVQAAARTPTRHATADVARQEALTIALPHRLPHHAKVSTFRYNFP